MTMCSLLRVLNNSWPKEIKIQEEMARGAVELLFCPQIDGKISKNCPFFQLGLQKNRMSLYYFIKRRKIAAVATAQ